MPNKPKSGKGKLNIKGRIVQKIVGEEPWFRSRQLLKTYQHLIEGKVIDLGGGEGKHRKFVAELPQVESYTSLDFYEKADITADLNEPLPIKDSQYDTAFCFAVLMYLKEPQMALNEAYRILKPGSYFLLFAFWHCPYVAYPTDYFRFSSDGLKYMLGKSGFEIVEMFSVGGRMKILTTFFITWFPFLKKFRPFFDKWFGAKKNRLDKDTPTYFVIAKKL